MNNLFLFEGVEVEILVLGEKVLFNPRHVAQCLDIIDVKSSIRNFNDKQKVKVTNNDLEVHDVGFRKLNNAGETFLTESGVYKLICMADKISLEKKKKLLNVFQINDITISSPRKEIEFLNQLEESLKPFNIKGEKQYSILSYRIDYYIPSLNIAIEYDENDHDNYTYKQHEGRQKEIERELGCKFIRVSDKNTNEYNIGYVIKNIFNL